MLKLEFKMASWRLTNLESNGTKKETTLMLVSPCMHFNLIS